MHDGCGGGYRQRVWSRRVVGCTDRVITATRVVPPFTCVFFTVPLGGAGDMAMSVTATSFGTVGGVFMRLWTQPGPTAPSEVFPGGSFILGDRATGPEFIGLDPKTVPLFKRLSSSDQFLGVELSNNNAASPFMSVVLSLRKA